MRIIVLALLIFVFQRSIAQDLTTEAQRTVLFNGISIPENKHHALLQKPYYSEILNQEKSFGSISNEGANLSSENFRTAAGADNLLLNKLSLKEQTGAATIKTKSVFKYLNQNTYWEVELAEDTSTHQFNDTVSIIYFKGNSTGEKLEYVKKEKIDGKWEIIKLDSGLARNSLGNTFYLYQINNQVLVDANTDKKYIWVRDAKRNNEFGNQIFSKYETYNASGTITYGNWQEYKYEGVTQLYNLQKNLNDSTQTYYQSYKSSNVYNSEGGFSYSLSESWNKNGNLTSSSKTTPYKSGDITYIIGENWDISQSKWVKADSTVIINNQVGDVKYSVTNKYVAEVLTNIDSVITYSATRSAMWWYKRENDQMVLDWGFEVYRDSKGRTIVGYVTLKFGSFIQYQIERFAYNSQDKQTLFLNYRRFRNTDTDPFQATGSKNWQEFDSNGNLTSEGADITSTVTEVEENIVWTPNNKTEYTYGTSKVAQKVTYDYSNNVWVPEDSTYYTYNDFNLIINKRFVANSSSWQNDETEEYIYANGSYSDLCALTLTGDTIITQENVTLSAGFTAGSHFKWSLGNEMTGSNASTLQASLPGIYKVVASGDFCENSKFMKIYKTCDLNIEGDTLLTSASLELEAVDFPETGSYTWSDSLGTKLSEATTLTASNAGLYKVKAVGNNCVGEDIIKIYSICPISLSSDSVIIGSSLIVTATFEAGAIFSWKDTDGAIIGNSSSLEVSQPGTYKVEAQKGFCYGRASKNIVDFLTGTEEGIFDGIKTYPNPGNGQFVISLDSEPIPGTTYSILNGQGEEIQNRNINTKITPVNITSQPKGFYLLKIQAGNRIKIQKILKTN